MDDEEFIRLLMERWSRHPKRCAMNSELPEAGPVKSIDLGDGHRAELLHEGESEEPCGVIHHHPRPDGQGECVGYAGFRGKRRDSGPEWDVVSLEPLTLAPSLLCTICGCHGFIRDGKWVSC